MSRIGVVGEDRTDAATLRVLIQRLAPRVGVRLRAPSVGGCSRLLRKLPSYMRDLAADGCSALIVLHDLDRCPTNGELNDEAALRRRLDAIAAPPGVARLICIPVEEVEAWFWCDQGILDLVGKGGKANRSPHRIQRPKEQLLALSARAQRRPSYSTNMNEKLAESLDLDSCAACCPSFRELRDFVRRQVG